MSMIDFDLCKHILLNGGVVACPTDTVYGLFADASNDTAVKRVFDIKQRDLSKKLILNCSSFELVSKYVEFNDFARILSDRFWPGALSILFKLNSFGKNHISKFVYSDDFNIAFRVPDNDIALRLLSDMNVPLVSTSVNLSGSEPLNDALSIRSVFKNKIDYVIDDDSISNSNLSSTLISVVDEKPVILRLGKVNVSDIENALGCKVFVDNA